MDKVKSINKENLEIARNNVGLSTMSATRKISKSKIDLVFEWENGTSLPTWNQITRLAKIYDIPEVLFFSRESIKKNKTIPDYRIGQDSYNDEKIQKLINIVIRRQRWLKQNIKYNLKKNVLQGSGKEIQNPDQLALLIKEKLNIDSYEIKNISGVSSRKKVLDYLIRKAEDCGIFIGKTIHYHRIKVDDMRGLYISDDYCPYIILNRRDALSAQIFSLIHELAHLFRKTDSISNSLEFRHLNKNINYEEIFCNKVAAELLLPTKDLKKTFYDISDINNMAEIYKVSRLMIFYRLKDLNKIDKNDIDNLEEKIRKETDEDVIHKNNKKNTGGSYVNNMRDSNGKLFNNIILELYFDKKINYVEASNLLKFSVESL
ncbi:MAG: ImmA/IrrE family metallo-endopeptidase [Patescibacteria group bacterium]|nr:ImmA/IrrE family metallo-endopeptidase [Patescibacteria group bacterium]MDD4303916.1 ImmA/IrrE family metallo-endopeptidase [Patescibacteria group bacterium]MDD4695097.1 ImmA/IrrE family metallo-endopeptidase [Patescibacteria group bacterium]